MVRSISEKSRSSADVADIPSKYLSEWMDFGIPGDVETRTRMLSSADNSGEVAAAVAETGTFVLLNSAINSPPRPVNP